MLSWGGNIGPATREVVSIQLRSKDHPKQAYRSCLGLLNLTKKYGDVRLEQACKDALMVNKPYLRFIRNLLEQQREQLSTYAELTFEERLSLLLESEVLGRSQAKIQRLKRQAKLRVNALPSQLIYKEDRGLKRVQMSELLTGSYLLKHQNILITGPTGAGKTYVACALAAQACEQEYSVRYYRLSRLLDDLSSGRLDGSYQKQLLALSKKQLLILDDWGMEKLSQDPAGHLLELLEDRYQTASTIMISQLPVKEWYNMIDNATVADALLDRLIHNSHRIELGGESMRKLVQSELEKSEGNWCPD